MTDPHHQGVMAMVKIDGSKVRQLREQKSLTQLYLATAVEVTTDTISRWENRRYPTIKKDNAVKLAEALEVELEEILEKPSESEPETRAEQANANQIDTGPAIANHPQKNVRTTVKSGVYIRWPILLLSGTMAALIALVGWVFLSVDSPPAIVVTAERNLPNHCTVGQVFPVTIEVDVESKEPVAFIVKEQLPKGVRVVNSIPPLNNPRKNAKILKWLKKGHGKQTFTYTAIIEDRSNTIGTFRGSISINDTAKAPYSTSGSDSILISSYHWADSNRDNILSDSEILEVYDQFGEREGFGIDLELIEEIWLGSGYSWNPTANRYDILP